MRDAEQLQQDHYDTISAGYAAHYEDAHSTQYRAEFLFQRMFKTLDLRGKKVLDGMCGTGALTKYLLPRGAEVTGVDISPKVLDIYRRDCPGAHAVQQSMLTTGLPDASFDVVAIMGGLHHLQPHVPAAFDEVHRVLRPGGFFVFSEPEAGTLPDVFRKLWYRVDKYFASNEAPIDLPSLRAGQGDRFDFISVERGGGPAYFLVLNSLVFRVPLPLKNALAAPLMALDRVIEPRLPRLLSSYVVVQTQKR